MKLILFIGTCLCHLATANAYESVEKTYYEVSNIDQYDNYGDVSLFEHTVPDMTTMLQWRFETGSTNQKCPIRNVTVVLQHGSYPLPYSRNNKTYPDDFFLHCSSLQHVDLNTTGNVTILNISAPTAGQWFGAAFINYKEDNEVIQQITDLDCHYYILVNVTALSLLNLPMLTYGTPLDVSITPEDDYLLYRFHIEENVWYYDIHCSGSPEGMDCALLLSVKAGGLPLNGSSHEIDCASSSLQPCLLTVNSPAVNRWHYLMITTTKNSVVNATIQITMKGCSKALSIGANSRKNQKKSKEATNTAIDTAISTANTAKMVDTIMTDIVTPSSQLTTEISDHPTTPETNPNATDPSGEVCGPINNLYRTEDMNTADYALYSLGPQSADEILIVNPHQVALVQFDVMPIKDNGGTLVLTAVISEVAFNPNHTQEVTVKICLNPSRIPANGTQYYCPTEGSLEVFLDTENDSSLEQMRHIPYPEPNVYFVGFQSMCYVWTSNNSSERVKSYETCVENFTQVVFEIVNGPCVKKSCGGHGDCNTYRAGAYIYSSCHCYASYLGYTCEDDSEAASLQIQMLYTCLLSLSNIFFVPAIVLGIRNRYYVEALVYFSNMFFSAFYHACDVHPWSIYALCIMPYHVLSYCDFLLSILSFWVTLVAMADLPPAVVNVFHMLGAVALSMAVEWAQHSLLPYIVPISAGLLMVIVMWVLRCVRSKHCYPGKRNSLFMIPGFVLAIIGLVIFAFLQDDINYPYTHSAWHLCIASSIVFLLPRRHSDSSKSSDQSSDDIEFTDREDRHLHDNHDRSYLINGDNGILRLSRNMLSITDFDPLE